MSNRYATIIVDDDGREVVSAIGVFEGAAPRARIGRIEPVVAGVLIGMVRGGPVDAIGGFGFPHGTHDGRAIGLARAKLKAMPAKRGDAAADAADAASRKATRKPVKAKRRKSGKIKRPAKPAAQAEPVGISDHG
ncbi:hypothetical protein ACWGTI_20415 [Mesorhizobium sp. ArgA1]